MRTQEKCPKCGSTKLDKVFDGGLHCTKYDIYFMPGHHRWICKKCGHEVYAKEKPDLKWKDGHVCEFECNDTIIS